MENSFLNSVVKHLNKLNIEYDKVCIILPNKRAGLFLKKYLSESIDKPVWAPAIYSIEDFFIKLSDIKPLDNTALCFELYEIYKKVKKEEIDTLEDFLKWAPQLITDFSEIDSYGINGKGLFTNLSQVKELESWSLGEENLSELQKKYLDFWHLLERLYDQYKTHLLNIGKGYQGLIQSTANINAEEKLRSLKWEKYLFAGFNALNKCEEKLMQLMLNSGKAHLILDGDGYYLDNEQQEAGKYLRKYKEFFEENKKNKNTVSLLREGGISNTEKKITIIGAAKNILQSKIAGDILKKTIVSDKILSSTAIVLADEKLLFPVLNSIPNNIKDINVTMGYPLKNSLVAELISILFELHLRPERLKQTKDVFYHKDIIHFFKHPYIKSSLIQQGIYAPVSKLIHTITKKSIVFISRSHVLKILNDEKHAKVKKLIAPWKSSSDAAICIENTLLYVAESYIDKKNKNNSITAEFLSASMSIIKQINSLQAGFSETIAISTFQVLFTQLIKSTTVPFYGEPLKGLQIMGMLETRTLDFENIILLSANEGVLPSGKKNNSFIPHDIRRAFGLPTYSEKDSVFAYHFYRLIQRAKNIHIIYNTQTDEFGSGEKSRFITQLLNELPFVNKQVKLSELTQSSSSTFKREQIITINKTSEVTQKINKKIKSGLSPSSLNTYRNCSLRFYFQNIEGIQETDEVEENIGADTLGNIVHKTLQLLYEPFSGKVLNKEAIEGMLKNSHLVIEKSFNEDETISEINSGKNVLTVAIAKKFVSNFLKKEIQFIEEQSKQGLPVIIHNLEKELTYELIVGADKVTLKGICDRIDTVGNTIRIIDYKTGTAANNELKVDDWAEIRNNTKLNKSFQLLTYAWLYAKNEAKSNLELTSGIISFRELSAGLKSVQVQGGTILTTQILNSFENELTDICEEILNPNTSFKQTEDHEVCSYCTFKKICNR